MIKKVVPDYVSSQHELAHKVNEIIEVVNRLAGWQDQGACEMTVASGVDMEQLEVQIKASKSKKKAKGD